MHASRGSNWKLVVLIVILVIAVGILGFLCVQFFLLDQTPSAPASTVSTQVSVQDASNKNVTESVTVTEGTERPDIEDAELILLNIDWTDKKAANYPLIISVTNRAFTDNDGLAVYHYVSGAWELIGTYLIVDHTVSFRTESLSPFAFEVISAEPEPTPIVTPEPTATPEPTVTPEPTATPYVPDYGDYSTVQAGTYIQVNAIEEGGSYLIAVVEDPNADESNNSGVTFFDANTEEEPITAHILLNYDGEKMHTIMASASKNTDGQYVVMDPVVSGMIFTPADSFNFYGTTRFSLTNNEKFLNLDDKNENVVFDENSDPTRWCYGEISYKDENGHEVKLNTLTYRDNDGDTLYVSDMTYSEEDRTISFTMSEKAEEAIALVLFRQYDLSEVGNTGTVILTGTPSAMNGLDATPDPDPTATPNNHGGAVVPVTSTPRPTTAPTPVQTSSATTPPAATNPPEQTIAPVNTPSGGGAASGSDAGGDDDPATDSDA